MNKFWEQRVYEHYISTGKLASRPDPKLLFEPRRPYVEKVIREHIPSDKSVRIVELGCGPAPFLYFLKQRGYVNLAGIDVSSEQVALAHAVGLENEVVQGDIIAYLGAAKPASFDVIIMFDILEHFSIPEQFDIMDKVFAQLKPEGRCILHVPNAAGIFGTRVLYGDITHKSAFTYRSIEQLLLTVGFSEVKCFEDKPIPHSAFGFVRRIIWEMVTIGQVIALGAETGNIKRSEHILSQNMLVVASSRVWNSEISLP